MPELPEVETIKLGLAKIIGQKIKKVEVLNPKSFIGGHKEVEGKKITGIQRRAKVLIVELGSKTLLVHLKMSGQLILVNNQDVRNKKRSRFIGGHPTTDMFGDLPNKSTRVTIELEDYTLYFNDQRKFGWIKAINNEQLSINNLFNKLGPEPLDKGFSWKILKEGLFKRKSLPVKVAIMDQTVIAGVGNIYASEACFNARIDPRIKVKDLTDDQIRKLHRGIILSLKTAIKYGGSTRVHFVNPEGKKGYFLDYAKVYGRQGLPCRVCKKPVQKIQLGGRGTYFCEFCQLAHKN